MRRGLGFRVYVALLGPAAQQSEFLRYNRQQRAVPDSSNAIINTISGNELGQGPSLPRTQPPPAPTPHSLLQPSPRHLLQRLIHLRLLLDILQPLHISLDRIHLFQGSGLSLGFSRYSRDNSIT